MKYINKILSLFVIALIATSCDPDAESYTPGELEDGNQGICFVGNYTQTVEVEPGITSFDLTLTRSLTDAAGTVDVTVINNEENIFVCPSTVSFAAGEKTAKLTVETANLILCSRNFGKRTVNKETCTGSSCSFFNFHSHRNRRIYAKEISNCTVQIVSGTDRFPLQDSKIY